ncbi:MAG: mannose-1-phosphate guanylyltransferase [Candidatus Helarchaeota archaeon]|nr:mannose-1-phosphate guanylyltransferase [Candidatus Helarchaeota archaeon]
MYALIMAGGVGKRFWPWSRDKNPKQFLNIFGEKSLLEETVDRLRSIVKKEDIYIITTSSQKKRIVNLIKDILTENIIPEPIGRDTAACIGLGAILMSKKNPESVQIVLPSDHLISDVENFRKVLKKAAILAKEKDCLVTIGIKPTYPNTGYGYIQYTVGKEEELNEDIYKVKTFAEKPNLETAQRFLESGDFLWNSGIFVWKVKTILKEIETSLPELYDGLMEIERSFNKKNIYTTIRKVYSQIRSISIDYGVMEKAKDVYVVKGDFGWNDVGSWAEVYRLGNKDKNQNFIMGNVVLRDSKGNLIYSKKKLLTGIGINDMIIIDTNDVLLICPKDQSQNVKELVDYLKRKDMKEFL